MESEEEIVEIIEPVEDEVEDTIDSEDEKVPFWHKNWKIKARNNKIKKKKPGPKKASKLKRKYPFPRRKKRKRKPNKSGKLGGRPKKRATVTLKHKIFELIKTGALAADDEGKIPLGKKPKGKPGRPFLSEKEKFIKRRIESRLYDFIKVTT